jgi:triosephosphate isomerase
MSRRPFVAGNWKMHKTATEAGSFVRNLAVRVAATADVAVCPPFTALAAAVDAAAGTPLRVFAQTMHQLPQGPFTGEISAPMLLDLGVDGVLLGHSERRQYFGETDAALAEKVAAGLDAGLDVILAVGESEAEREAGETESVLERQVTAGLAQAGDRVVTIAYEPVWAIGTGKTATPELAQSAHAFVRGLLPESVRDATRIQYGGSMKPENAAELLAQPDIDGGLIGGASLEAEPFLAIAAAAR